MSMITFLEMLEFKRPAFTVYEEAFIDKYLRVIPGIVEDEYGNLMIDVGDKPNIIWSSHTDTVHHESGLQRVIVDKNRIARVKFPKESNCLGADCTTGVYIMIEMIKAKVPGRYIFHRDEEHGRHGSTYIATKTPDILKGIDAAIAFDRKGLTDVITHQSYRTASNEFAESFAAIVGMNYKPSPNGSFTDTKSYMALVPECTNISVGYAGAHSSAESQDLTHLEKLTEVMCRFDSSSLVIKRTPEEEMAHNYHWQGGGGNFHQGVREPTNVFEFVRETPWSVSKLLEMEGWTLESIKEAVTMIQTKKEFDIVDDAVTTDGQRLPRQLIEKPRSAGNQQHKVGIH